MKRLSAPGIVLPLLLAVVGVTLIVVGQLQLDASPSGSLPGIPEPSSPVAVASLSPSVAPSVSVSVAPTPSPTPIPDTWVAVQIQVASVDLNVAVKHATAAQSGFPPDDGAYVLYESSEPGRGTNSYIIGHALQHLFKRLWNVQLGAEVRVLMSDGAVLRYVVTEIHPNISCPDSRAPKAPKPPLALIYAPPGCAGAAWTQPTDHERLTLQTSQGYNRNWGELIVVAKPVA
ncbi:MAG: sortase [Chloroflexota bacterium]|nr:sortase [Chloroflexota bacterium]